MNYMVNSKNRKLKHKVYLFANRLSFNFLNLTLSQKISFVGIIIAFFSLFVNWFTIESTIKNNAFSLNAGYIGFIVVIMLGILVFIILSNINKEKLKSKVNIIFYDHTIIIFFGIIIFLLTLVVFNSIRGFIVFNQNIIIGKGIIFELMGSVFIIAGGILNYREKKQELLHKIYVENNQLNGEADLEEYRNIIGDKSNNDKKNMSLPI